MPSRYPGKILIGLTGNIATGKSLVREMLAELGAATIDADQVAHTVLEPDGAAYAAVVDTFGGAILTSDGQIDRGQLGEIVFADRAKLRQLESITHPVIGIEIERLIQAASANVVVIEAIKLLEGRWRDAVDSIWVVDASEAARLDRLMTRRGLSEETARSRIAAQNPQALKLRQADVIIKNDGGIEQTRARVQRAWREMME